MLNALNGKVAYIHIIVFWSDRISLEIMISLDDFYSQRSRLLLRMLILTSRKSLYHRKSSVATWKEVRELDLFLNQLSVLE
jgi:hypothetical protein